MSVDGIQKTRIASVDIFRGLVVLLFVLEMCRIYFHQYAFDFSPYDLKYTTPLAFFFKYILDFSVPLFVLVGGIGFFLKRKNTQLSNAMFRKYLIKRGLLFVVIDTVVIRFLFRFDFDWHFWNPSLFFSLGITMIIFSLVFTWDRNVLFYLAILLILSISYLGLYSTDHLPVFVQLADAVFLNFKNVVLIKHQEVYFETSYPVISVFALYCIGYYMGFWYTEYYQTAMRKKYFINWGLLTLSLFLSLRLLQFVFVQYEYLLWPKSGDGANAIAFKSLAVNFLKYFGDLKYFELQDTMSLNVVAFFNTSVHHFTFHYFLLVLSAAFFMFYLIELKTFKEAKWYQELEQTVVLPKWLVFIREIGKKPFLFILTSILVAHVLSLVVALSVNWSIYTAVLNSGWIALSLVYGYSLPYVILVFPIVLFLTFLLHYFFVKKIKSGIFKIL